jgi:hypothetical protein
MASYCIHCGSAVSGAFCVQCGKPATPAPQPSPTPAVRAAPVAKGGMSAGAKVLLALFGLFVLFGAVTVGGFVFAGYRVKRKVEQLKREYGAELRGEPAAIVPTVAQVTGNGCPTLDAAEASKLLAVAIVRVESRRDSTGAEGCDFYAAPGELQRIARNQMAAALNRVGSRETDEKAGMAETERMMRGGMNMFQSVVGQSDKDVILRTLIQRGNGQRAWERLQSGENMVLPSGTALQQTLHAVDGVGDKAEGAPGGVTMFVLKGDSFFNVFFGFVPGEEKATEVARRVASKL